MKNSISKFTYIFLAGLVIGTTLFSCVESSAQSKTPDVTVITDIATWKHPVKDVLTRNKVQLSKVELTKNKKYPIFFVTFPYDPQSSQTSDYFNQLYAEILDANGWWSYALHDDQDQILIEVNWDKKKEVMSTEIIPLQDSKIDKKQTP